MSKLVRLYPKNPHRGWYLQTYLHYQLQMKFVGTRGWYKVSDDVAEKLRDVLQIQEDPRSGPAFMIAADKEEAAKLEKSLLADPKEADKKVGTFDEPVSVARPGRATAAAVEAPEKVEEEAPKRRGRKRAG